jgi:hypothetical protein
MNADEAADKHRPTFLMAWDKSTRVACHAGATPNSSDAANPRPSAIVTATVR